MTELDFLLELLLNHKLQKSTAQAIKERISLVQSQIATGTTRILPPINVPQMAVVNGQSPSMAAKVAAMEAEKAMQNGQASGQHSTIQPPPLPPVVPASPVAQQALQIRNQAIQEALSESGGRFLPGRKAARKF